MDEKDPTRRKFLSGAAAAGAAAAATGCANFNIVPRSVLGGSPKFVPPSQKMNVASIGCGGKGESDVEQVGATENIVALCDVDQDRGAKSFKKFPDAKRYVDFRELLDKEKTLDAVIVSTPDHMHAPIALAAMKRGLHVYCQKPLTHDVFEARRMREASEKYNVVTQMGNQGTSENGLRRAVELIQSGTIGPVREAHVWTNRPVWPQGHELTAPLPEEPARESMNWPLWLGTAPVRPYNKHYAPFTWRGWWDFGTGALGDMACHTANMAFMALNLAYPTKIEVTSAKINPQTYPDWSVIKFHFPKRGDMPACTLTWYDGGKRPPKDLVEGQEFSNSGSLLIGDKGKLFSPNDYGAKFMLLPEASFKDVTNLTKPERLPESPGGGGDESQKMEWINACKGTGKTMSNFSYAALLTETILLGNIALRAGDMEWDGPNMKSPNNPKANDLVRRTYNGEYEV